MFNNKDFNAKLSVKLANLTKIGGNATILKQLINGVNNAVTVGLKADNGVIAAINTKYASGNPDAFLKLAQGDSLVWLGKGYKALAQGKPLSKGLVEAIASTKLELVKASALYALAKGDKNAAAAIGEAIASHKEARKAIGDAIAVANEVVVNEVVVNEVVVNEVVANEVVVNEAAANVDPMAAIFAAIAVAKEEDLAALTRAIKNRRAVLKAAQVA